jgi:hypothetical protein
MLELAGVDRLPDASSELAGPAALFLRRCWTGVDDLDRDEAAASLAGVLSREREDAVQFVRWIKVRAAAVARELAGRGALHARTAEDQADEGALVRVWRRRRTRRAVADAQAQPAVGLPRTLDVMKRHTLHTPGGRGGSQPPLLLR